jgi:hypothetical protein
MGVKRIESNRICDESLGNGSDRRPGSEKRDVCCRSCCEKKDMTRGWMDRGRPLREALGACPASFWSVINLFCLPPPKGSGRRILTN